MTMELYKEDDPAAFKQFLDDFCKKYTENAAAGDILPFRVPSSLLREEEREAETLDWVVSYLTAKKCPHLLAAEVARATWDGLTDLDVTEYIEPAKTNNREDSEEEDGEEDGEEDRVEKMEPEPPAKHLNSEKLSKLVISKVHEICVRWRESLPTMPQSKRKFDISVATIKNIRRRMEDRHVVLPHLNSLFALKDTASNAYFAVFDGHGGLEAAIYASQHLHCNMVHDPHFLASTDSAMHDSFCKTDTQFLSKAKYEKLKSGSTGVCALLRDQTLYYSWLGDSQFVLVRDGEPIELMQPHKPEREDEKKRIEALGGCVVWYGAWRVNGSLSVSRAIGDPDFKPYVSAEPDVGQCEMMGNEDYMVLACDGLWDVITFDHLVHLVYDHLHSKNGDKSTVATHLMDAAIEEGSSDNISIIVVFFRDDIAKPKPKKKEGSTEENEAAADGNNDGKDSDSDKNVPDDNPAPDNNDKSGNKPGGDSENQQGNNGGDEKKSGDADSEHGKSAAGYIGEFSSSGKTSVDCSRSRTLVVNSDGPQLDVGYSHIDDSIRVSNPQTQDVDLISKKLSSENLPGCSGDIVQSDCKERETGSDAPQYPHSMSQVNALLNSDLQSDVSSTDMRVMSQSASRCLRNRRVKRQKGASRRKNGRRAARDKSTRGGSSSSSSSSGRTENAAAPHRAPPGVSTSSKAPSTHTMMNLSLTADNLFLDASNVLTRYTRCRARSLGNWTVAVEIESASAMFND